MLERERESKQHFHFYLLILINLFDSLSRRHSQSDINGDDADAKLLKSSTFSSASISFLLFQIAIIVDEFRSDESISLSIIFFHDCIIVVVLINLELELFCSDSGLCLSSPV